MEKNGKMNVVDFLMQMDAGKLAEVPTKEVKVKSLSEKAGRDITVTVKALPGRKVTELTGLAVKDGEVDVKRAFDANLLIVTYGLVEPDAKNEDLQEHFGAASPKDLVEKLFNGGEIVNLAGEIRKLSGYDEDEKTDEEIKN